MELEVKLYVDAVNLGSIKSTAIKFKPQTSDHERIFILNPGAEGHILSSQH